MMERNMEKIVLGNVDDIGEGWGYIEEKWIKYEERIKKIDI